MSILYELEFAFGDMLFQEEVECLYQSSGSSYCLSQIIAQYFFSLTALLRW